MLVVAMAVAGTVAGAGVEIAHAQTAGRSRVAGVVTDATTRQPLPGVTVRVLGTSFAAVTGADGRYVITNAAPGLFNVEARRIGYGVGRVDNVRLTADSIRTLDFRLNDNPLRLQNVVVTGTIEPTQGAKTPFTVATLTAADMPVPPNISVAGMIQGKVSGVQVIRGTGPGAGVNVQIRTPTSQFKTNSPIYVVDGVVLNTQVAGITRDLEALDVASIEVIKGAAATSLYGSLGANGVVAITTNRGNNLALNTTQFTARTEGGFNQFYRLPGRPLHHAFRTNAAGGWVNAAGRDTSRVGRTLKAVAFKDTPYAGTTYDQAGEFLSPGRTATVNLQLSQNTAASNFAISYARTHDLGLVEGSNGWLRQNIRVNVDTRRGDRFNLGVSAYHARAQEEPAGVSFADFFGLDPDVNIRLRAPDGRPAVLPDSASTIVNPLYRQQFLQDSSTSRGRTLLSTNASFKLSEQFTARADVNYDRSDRVLDNYVPRGVLAADGQTLTLGLYQRDNDVVEGINGTVGLTWSDRFGRLSPRVTAQGLIRRETNPFSIAQATDFSVSGVRDLDVGQTRQVTSSYTDRRLRTGILSANLDFADKLIGDFSVSREGNSLFGADARWNNWYRASGAYRMAEETWWPFASVNEFKLRYSYGTAGSRPSFYDQYETLELAAGGLPTRQSLGNRALRPEISEEQEFGVDAVINNRISASLVYALRNNKDQIIAIPLPALSGFNTQEQNVGTTRGRILEFELQAQLLRRGSFAWEANFNATRARSRLTGFGRSCYTEGILSRCDGADIDEMWGFELARSAAQIPGIHQGASRDAFQVNDDGYLVAVGAGNTWRDGVAKSLWGTTVRVDGANYAWGRPILVRDSTGLTPRYSRLGRSLPDATFGLQNTFRWRGFQLYGLLMGQLGGNVYNLQKRTLYASNDHVDVAQAGKAEETKKPVQYYSAADGLAGQTYASHFVESGTHAKLQEMSLRYTLPSALLRRLGRVGGAADRVALELIGRNLALFTNYTGIDPEAGSPLQRVNGTTYPQIRNYTAAVTLVF